MTRKEFDEACKRANAKMKETAGHAFVTILKTRCDLCGLSPKQAARVKHCSGWFQTFLNRLAEELVTAPRPAVEKEGT